VSSTEDNAHDVSGQCRLVVNCMTDCSVDGLPCTQVELLLEDLPGALALLQEAGDVRTVLEWGGAWLAQPSGDAQVPHGTH